MALDVSLLGVDLIATGGLEVSSLHQGDGYGMGNYGEDPAPADAYGTPRHIIGQTLVGVDLLVNAGLSAGSVAETDEVLPGAALVASASIAAGSVSIGVARPGADLRVNAVLEPANVTAGGSLVVSGARLTVNASISAGSASVSWALSGAALGVTASLLPGQLITLGVDLPVQVKFDAGFPYILVNMAVPGQDLYAVGSILGSSIHGTDEWDEVIPDDDDFGPWIPEPAEDMPWVRQPPALVKWVATAPEDSPWVPQDLPANWSD